MIAIIKSVIIVILCLGGIGFAIYDLLTGKISEDPVLRKRIMKVLYILLILNGISIIVKHVEIIINQ